MHNKSAFRILVDESGSGQRLDVFITSRTTVSSRSMAADLIRSGNIRVHGEIKKPGYRIRTGDDIYGRIPPPEPVSFKPEPIEIDILYEDNHLVVVNKQAGLVVHPGPGHTSGTLVNALLYHLPDLEGIGGELRPGIVHRLDKETSGALVVAKTDVAHINLSRQFKNRTIKKTYLALVQGEMKSESGTISLEIGRHPVDRKRMSTRSRKGRIAQTSWRVREYFYGATLIELDLKTGRTHQIRVHCAAIHRPIVGDSTYGIRKPGKDDFPGKDLMSSAPRQMLHAWRLQFDHPTLETSISAEAPVPPDMTLLINELRKIKRRKK
ncbi:RluA family pseudouridine synthase [Thermodesulfobacteriota bacterium]